MTAPARSQRLLVCNCQRTMEIDGKRLAEALGLPEPLVVHTELCRSQIAAFEAGLGPGATVHVACTQEAPLFREVAARRRGRGRPRLHQHPRAGRLVRRQVRRPAEDGGAAGRGGATAQADRGHHAQVGRACASSTAAARPPSTSPPSCRGRLSVTVLLSDPEEALPPGIVSVPIYKGRIRTATGHLGRFEIEVDGYAPMLPSSKGALAVRDAARRRALHLRHHLRHVRRHAAVRRRAAPRRLPARRPEPPGRRGARHAAGSPTSSASSRSRSTSATTPASARTPAARRSAAPTASTTARPAPSRPTAITSPSMPPSAAAAATAAPCARRARSATPIPSAATWWRACGMLLEDLPQGRRHAARPAVPRREARQPLISAMARLGKGLPPNVLPLSLFSVLQLGHEALAAALAFGAEHIVVLAPPEHPAELAALESQTALTGAFLDGLGYAGPRLHVVERARPRRGRGAALRPAAAADASAPEAFAAIGSKRDIARTALAKLKAAAPAPRTSSRCLPARPTAASTSTSPAARCASPASAPARRPRSPTTRSGRSSPSRRAPACSAGSAWRPARRR